jgi:AraC family transcriptional regulator
VQGISLALAAYVSAKYGGHAEVVEPHGGFDEVQRAVLVDYVESHVGLNIGLLDLASLVGYSPDHFTRLFKMSFGTTPHRYLLERRVARAKTLLRERRHSIAEIALDCGFSGQTHLNVVFKRLTGSTPGAFRKH